ncbi:hypothetical protein pb186bvf_004119 [Paramecium bursaria]
MSSKDKKASKKVTKKKSADKEDTKSAKDLDSPQTQLLIGRAFCRQGQKDIDDVSPAQKGRGYQDDITLERARSNSNGFDEKYSKSHDNFHHKGLEQKLYENQNEQKIYAYTPQIDQRQNKFMFDPQYHPQYLAYTPVTNLRVNRITEQISLNLIPKKEKLINQIQRIEQRIEDIKYAEQKIEQFTREEMEGYIQRLRQAASIKISTLNHDLFELKREVEAINALVHDYNNLQDLQNTTALQIFEAVENLSIRPIKTSIDVYPDDLPQEFLNLKKQAQQSVMLQNMMDFKNELIWKLHSEQQGELKKLKDELELQANQEFQKWAQLVDQFQQELEKYKMQCSFCGIKFDYQIINTICLLNKQGIEIKGNQEIPQEFIGTQRHYFDKK